MLKAILRPLFLSSGFAQKYLLIRNGWKNSGEINPERYKFREKPYEKYPERYVCGPEKSGGGVFRLQVVRKEFADMDEAKAWVIRNQFGRRNLSAYDRSVLALKLKPLIAEKAKEQQARKSVSQKSVEQKPIDTQKELAKIAGVSHDTIHKVDVIEQKATEVYNQKLEEAQAIAEVVTDAECRMGELLKAVPKATPNNNPYHEISPHVDLVKPKSEVVKESGLTQDRRVNGTSAESEREPIYQNAKRHRCRKAKAKNGSYP